MPLFMASAYYGVRHTRRGYRFRPAAIIALCVSASAGLGVLLHFFEAGRLVNDFLAANIAAYREQTDVPFDKWSQPDSGFLGGTVESVDGTKNLRLKDFHDKQWLVDISGAVITLDNAIADEGDIAIRGIRTGPSDFRAETIEEFD